MCDLFKKSMNKNQIVLGLSIVCVQKRNSSALLRPYTP